MALKTKTMVIVHIKIKRKYIPGVILFQKFTIAYIFEEFTVSPQDGSSVGIDKTDALN